MIEINGHRLTNHNIMGGIGNLMQGEKADIFYSDPPWGQANLNYWITIHKRHTGINEPQIGYGGFINQIFTLAAENTSGMIFIEYGIKWAQDIIDTGKSFGLEHLGVAQIKYPSGGKFLPHHLHIFTNANKTIPGGYLERLTGTTGIDCLMIAVRPFLKAGGIIMDPCCGLGMTSRLAYQVSMRFRGNELNSKRLQKTIDWLSKKYD